MTGISPDIERTSSEELKYNPETLLHRARPDLPVDSFTGAIGAVISDGWFFVMSPNAKVIFEPQLDQRKIHLCADYRLGTDDYALWPQLFT
ncbi:hypothetical protein C8J56DRAFT_1046257 [Mycena floridula]|nr:hypothetical protein C8J56DRAFT_1046257 [Mycena floridula]